MSSSVCSFSRNVGLPLIEAEPRTRQREHTREIHVAGEFQRIFRLVGQLVDVDEQRVDVVRGARVAPS